MSDSNELINQIFKCEVVRVHEYGGFAKVLKQGVQGLIHRSQISSTNVSDANEVLQAGDSVWCKVISVKDGKIGLSMKHVNQGNGADLDPNGVQADLDERNRKERPGKSDRKKIELGAIYKTICAKCGVEGHLKKDCFMTPDGKTYELLEEPETEKKIFGTEEDLLKRTKHFTDTNKRKHEEEPHERISKKKKKKEKKRHKEKKSKKKKRRSSSSSD